MTVLEQFCSFVEARSLENRQAAACLCDFPGQMMSLIRQELDSLIRVLYLLSISDLAERNRLMKQTIEGGKWTTITNNGKEKKITDRDMVQRAETMTNWGWTKIAYQFGCSFIHLSNYHGYLEENPLDRLSEEDRNNILDYMRYYHGGPLSDEPSFLEFASYFPEVFNKISGNLTCYLEYLKNEDVDEEWVYD